MAKNDLSSGWACDALIGATLHFEHIPHSEAEEMAEIRELCFVVETINWTFAVGDEKHVHRNRYFTLDMPSAIALAARMEIDFREVAEDVVDIRPATPEEVERFLAVSQHFEERLPEAISDEQAAALPSVDE